MKVLWVAAMLCACAGLQSIEECDEDVEICVAGPEARIPKGANELGLPAMAPVDCLDRHEKCRLFKENNGCSTSPGWMIVNCPVACDSCHLRDPKIRCRFDNLNMSSTPAFLPGQIEELFDSIVFHYEHKYDIQVHSTAPWIISLHNFMSESETKALIGRVTSWERATDSGLINDYGEQGLVVSPTHTSSSAWCKADCESNPAVSRIKRRISEVTNIDSSHFEQFQILKYEVGQMYGPHYDYIPGLNEAICGPRVLTFLLYLSDVEEGGETYFPDLDITVTPSRGTALVWANTMDSAPGSALEPRTKHEARPVTKGKKYAANAWVHQYDFKTPNLWGCTGAFDVL